MENTTNDVLQETLFAVFATQESPTTEYADGEELSTSDKFGVAVYCIIGLFGFVGNLFACIVFKTLRTKRNQVSLLIFTQATADLVSSIVLIIFGITRVYRHRLPTSGSAGEWLCRFWWSRFVIFYFFAISTYNLTLISLERYIAVVHPMAYAKRFTSRNTKIFVAIIWLFCPIMQYGQPLWGYSAASGSCETVESWENFGKAFFGILLYLWELITPICVMGVCYFSIVRTLRLKENACRTHASVKVKPEARAGSVIKPTKRKVRRDITMTLLILFILFVICWTPNQTTFVQFNLGGSLDFNGGWYHFTVILGFLNCCVNPFVYAFRLRQFRVRVLLMLQCRCSAISHADESDNELFRDPASSGKWSSRREKLGKIFKLTRHDTGSPSRSAELEATSSPQGSPFPTKKPPGHRTNTQAWDKVNDLQSPV